MGLGSSVAVRSSCTRLSVTPGKKHIQFGLSGNITGSPTPARDQKREHG